MTVGPLITIEAAAAELGVPVRALRRVAEDHGFVVRMGRAIRLDRGQMTELIRKCQNAPKGPASTGTATGASGSYETVADLKLRQAQATVERLKSGLRNTSQPGTDRPPARVMPLRS